jgi:tRNA pseudouridine38-40 synthase
MTQRWALTIEYDGRGYHGWQRQPDNIPSVQQAIESAIKRFCQQDITLHVAGRTDAGVHAKGQIAHFDLDYKKEDLTAFELTKAINAHLKNHPITILKASKVSGDFHARFHAKNKLYQYRVLQRHAKPTTENGLIWHVKKPLALEPMQNAAKHLLGHHDFSSFRDSQCQAKTPMRSLERADIETQQYDHCGGLEYLFSFEGKSFLHHQIRNIVGSLIYVGLGKWDADYMKAVLEAKDRTKAGPTAPPDGLYMVRIDFDGVTLT